MLVFTFAFRRNPEDGHSFPQLCEQLANAFELLAGVTQLR